MPSTTTNLSIITDLSYAPLVVAIKTIPITNKVLDISNIEVSIPSNTQESSILLSNLTQLLLESLPLPSYNLTVIEMNWIQEFIRVSPNTFQNIVKDLQEITADGKIDIHDIPAIIRLFADTYNSDVIKVGLSSAQNVITFIKFTLDVLLQSELLVLPDKEKKVIQSVVDNSLTLLSMNLDNIVAIQKKWFVWC